MFCVICEVIIDGYVGDALLSEIAIHFADCNVVLCVIIHGRTNVDLLSKLYLPK